MIASEPFLKTQQVANALGVSVATVKRWVDAGIIRAARTVGKHRLISASEVKRIAAETGVKLSSKGGLFEIEGGSSRADDPQIIDTLANLLRDGNAAESRALIRSVSRSCRNAADLADRLIGPVMERVGHDWMVGSLDVFQEHLATSIVAAAIQEQIDDLGFKRPRHLRLAIGATTDGDFYVMPGLLAELLLRESGWEVSNLGTNLPLRSLANAAREYNPQLIFLSINYLQDEVRFIREYLAFYQAVADLDVAVIIGGRALRPELRSQLPYTAFGDRMSHLAEFAKQLTPRVMTRAKTSPDSHLADDLPPRSPEHHE